MAGLLAVLVLFGTELHRHRHQATVLHAPLSDHLFGEFPHLAGNASRLLEHLATLATQASKATGVSEPVCLEYLSGLDYGLSYEHLAGLTEFFRRLVAAGRVPNGTLTFLPAA